MTQGLPQGWSSVQVQELFHSFSGGTPSKGNPAYWGGKIPWFSSGDIKSSQVASASESITRAGLDNSSSRLCRPGSVLVVVRSGVLKHTLPVAILEREAAINQDLKCFDSGDDAINKWLALSLRASENELLALNREGTTVQSVKYETLKEHKLPIPPLAEHQRIVEKLEVLLGKVDACRKRLEKIPVILKRFRQSVLAAACSGRLTADWREEHPEADSVRQVLPGLRDSAGLPETWVWCPLGEYADNLDGKRIPVSAVEREKRKGAFPYYGASGVIDSINGFTHEGEFVLIGEDGANLLSRSTPIAFIAKGKIWVNNHAHVLRCKGGMPNEFLAFYINSIDLAPYVTGTAQPKLNQANMNSIPVPLPPLPEQHEIVRRVEALFALVDQIETRYAKAKTHVDRLTQSILAKTFRGDLVPQDPNDEPASVLLERIRL